MKSLIQFAFIGAAISVSAAAVADQTDKIVHSMCEGNRQGIAAIADAYEQDPTPLVKDTLMQSYQNEQHQPTSEFMTDVVEYVLERGDRGLEYLQSEEFMESCLSVMNQKVANMKAQIRQQNPDLDDNTARMIPGQSPSSSIGDQNSSRWNMENRR
jgi:hypothetical protein